MNEQDYIIIEDFLEGTLAADVRAEVNNRLATDPAFAQAMADRRRLYEHLRAKAGEEALRATLGQLGERHFVAGDEPAAVVRPINHRRRWLTGLAAAAAIALLLLFGGRLFAPATGNTYEQFAQHQPLSLTERGVDNAAAAAEAAFNAGRYAEAVDRLRTYLEVQSEDERARLALGISLLERNEDSLAVKVFNEIAAGGTSLAPYGNWYLALAAVKRGDNAASLRFLALIPEGDAYLADRVRKLKATL